MLQARDKSGLTLGEVLRQENGIQDPKAAVAASAIPAAGISEYIEVHMEQASFRGHAQRRVVICFSTSR
jgi:hypothetical protein